MHNLEKTHFKGQLPGEVVLQVVRRHWFDILIQYIPVIALLLAILTALAAFPGYFTDYLGISLVLFYFVGSIFIMALWMYAALIWIEYYLDVWIITNKRVVNVEQKGLFLRHVSELRYMKIQDITTEVKGIIPTLLNYGEVYIQTAGTQPRFLFHNVPDPNGIKGTLVELQKRIRRRELGEIRHVLSGGRPGME